MKHTLPFIIHCIAPVSVTPGNVNVQRSADGTSVLISWEPVSLEEAKGFFVYHITLTSGDSTALRQVDRARRVTVPFNETSVNITDVESQRTYTVTVSIAVLSERGGEVIEGPASPPNLVVLPVIIGDVTVALTVPVVNDTTINITWSPPILPNGKITHYSVRVSTDDISSVNSVQSVLDRVLFTLIFGGLRKYPDYAFEGRENLQIGK